MRLVRGFALRYVMRMTKSLFCFLKTDVKKLGTVFALL